MEFGAFEMFGLSGLAVADGGQAVSLHLVSPHLALGLFDDKSLVMNLERPDEYAPDLSYIRYSWRVPVSKEAIRRYAQTPVSGTNSPTAFRFADDEAVRLTLEWQVEEDGYAQGRFTCDRPHTCALYCNGCFAPAEIHAATASALSLQQNGTEFFVRLSGPAEEPILAADRLQAENALLWPGFQTTGNAIALHRLTLTPQQPLYFTIAALQTPPAPDAITICERLACERTRFAANRMRSTGIAAGAAEAVSGLSGYGRAYDPVRQKIQMTVNRTWGGLNSPGMICGWDNFFMPYIAAWDNPELAARSLEHIVGIYGERGIENGPTQRNLIIPVLYCRTIEITGDLDLARRTWDTMCSFMRFWFSDRGDGIPWRDGNRDGLIDSGSSLDPAKVRAGAIISSAMDETGYDEIPTYSAGFCDQRRGLLPEGVEFDWPSKCLSVALICQNSLYISSCKKMSQLAHKLGNAEDAKWLQSEAERVGTRMQEVLYDSASGIYRNRHWNGEFSPVNTLTLFFPLLTGLPDEEAKQKLRAMLLDPEMFWGDNLVPSVARNDPHYCDGIDRKGNYWRGNCWAPTTYMCWLAIREAGWYDISAELAEKVTAQFMKYWTAFGHAYENYPAEGEVDHSYIYPGGAWGGREIRYVWTAMMPLCLLEELFAVESVGEGYQFGNPYLRHESKWDGFLCAGHRVSAAASAQRTEVHFGNEWSFTAKPGIVVRHFRIAEDEILFDAIPRDKEVRIAISTAASHRTGKSPCIIVNGKPCPSVMLSADGAQMEFVLKGS